MKIEISGTIIPNDDEWIYDWLELDCTSPRKVNRLLDEANGSDVDVYINSGGGDIFAGSEIYSALRSYGGKVNIHVVGIAASAASVIACAGYSDISPTAMMMIHNVSSGASGDYHVMDKESVILQKANKAICSAYMAKCNISETDALSMMDRESWLTASEAVELGLIDKIAENKNIRLVADIGNMISSKTIEKLKAQINTGAASLEKEKLNLLKLKGEFKNDI